MLYELLDCIIKAQQSQMKCGAQKKTWVKECMAGSGYSDFVTIGIWIDFIILLLKDPAVHRLFVRTQKSCLESLGCPCDTDQD